VIKVETSSKMSKVSVTPRHLNEKWMVSKKSKKRPSPKQLDDQSSNPMTFYPSLEELANFSSYVAYMESQGAHKAGIARIVPPKDWSARKAGYEPSEINIVIDKPMKQNIAITDTPGAFTTIAEKSIPPSSLLEYFHLANSPKYLAPTHSSYEELEQLYWRQNSDASLPSPVYGADVQASLTDPEQAVFNLTKLPSILSGMSEQIPGINLPYLFIGMWRATFSWHIEDMDLYAVNFLHHGAPKTWYCVPPQFGYKLEQLAQELFPDMAETCFNLLRHKAVLIGPDLLRAHDIPVNKMVHQQGTIMVVFPHAYHSGFNHGFNIAEALNFALPRWVEYGKRFRGCLCTKQNRDVSIDMDPFVLRFQPEAYDKWKRGDDFALHPEDPVFMKKYLEDLQMRVDLGFIKRSKFEDLIQELKLKREISPWFKKKFPLCYSDVLESVEVDEALRKTKADENANMIPELLAREKEPKRVCLNGSNCAVETNPSLEERDRKFLVHMASVMDGADKKWQCVLCGYISKLKGDIRDHVEATHMDNSFFYSCKYCSKVLNTKRKMNLHEFHHRTDEKYRL